ncbi:histidine kinase N-terminal 7TM domain-containing protein [Natronosalvus halobius]|uniref:histidine kinase N-terminal 7TM domain-containing protein n=1 Tax=Natronosalvus halobius TaxID=2953746 RepID=UPI00209CE5C8|nr:histidine kinase N-terminal 7TM domain-containing protein [Natronosalvus halobius]USZ72104.1 PAS domain-containing protein [Natronosalvus halobius]
MEWHLSLWTALLSASALVSFGFAMYVFRNYYPRNDVVVVAFFGIATATVWWSLTYALQVSATTVSAKLAWNRFLWIGVALMMLSWPLFILVYTGGERWARGRRLALLAAVPTATLLVVWSGRADQFMYLDPTVEYVDGLYVLTFTPGAFFLFVQVYSYAINFVTYVLLWRTIRRQAGPVRRQAILLLLAGLVPAVATIVGMTGWITPLFFDLTPVAFLLTTPLVAWALFSHRLFEISPIARDVVFENLAEGVVVLSHEKTVIDANDPARSLFGDRILGSSLVDAFEAYPEVVSVVENDAEDARVTVEASGGAKRLEVSALGVTSGSTVATVLLFEDVTDEETFQRRYQSMIEKSPNVVATIDESWTLRYVSPSLTRVLGYEPTQVVERSLLEYVHPDDREDVRKLRKQVSERSSSGSVQHRARHVDGTWSLFRTTIEPLFDGAGEFVVTGTDVTDERIYEQRLQVLNRVLRHDVKNNVNIITGYANLLEDHVDAGGESHLETIEEKATALAELSELARDVDMVLHGEADHRTVDMAAAVDAATERLQRRYDDAIVTVDIDVNADANEKALALVNPLYTSAIDNVLKNAVEHSDRSDPSIEVTIDRTETTVDVVIADDGPGIPAVEQEVLTAGRETSLEHASGLGLWLVNWVVARSGGDVEFAENDPRGSIVRLRFPRATTATASAQAS